MQSMKQHFIPHCEIKMTDRTSTLTIRPTYDNPLVAVLKGFHNLNQKDWFWWMKFEIKYELNIN